VNADREHFDKLNALALELAQDMYQKHVVERSDIDNVGFAGEQEVLKFGILATACQIIVKNAHEYADRVKDQMSPQQKAEFLNRMDSFIKDEEYVPLTEKEEDNKSWN
jgi:hypothetical protein